MGRERAVDLVGGSGNGTPCRGPGGQPERITDPDQDRWPVPPQSVQHRPSRRAHRGSPRV